MPDLQEAAAEYRAAIADHRAAQDREEVARRKLAEAEKAVERQFDRVREAQEQLMQAAE